MKNNTQTTPIKMDSKQSTEICIGNICIKTRTGDVSAAKPYLDAQGRTVYEMTKGGTILIPFKAV